MPADAKDSAGPGDSYVGRCTACSQPISGREGFTNVYGDLFHRECAAVHRRAREAPLLNHVSRLHAP